MAIAAAQKFPAQLRQAGMAAPMAVQHRWPDRVSPESLVARDRHRAGRQQIIRRQRR
jgi:hypothetical protein